jgi:CTP synthase
MRLGSYPAKLDAGSIAAKAYGKQLVADRHRHRYEVNNSYRDRLAESGLQFSGTSPDGNLVEIVELPREIHPFYLGTQAHPEFTSRPTKAHPLFGAFIAAAVKHSESKLLDLVAG